MFRTLETASIKGSDMKLFLCITVFLVGMMFGEIVRELLRGED